jgi:hypothetical protein
MTIIGSRIVFETGKVFPKEVARSDAYGRESGQNLMPISCSP